MEPLFRDEPTAVEVATRVRDRQVSPLEVLAHYESRIEARNPLINAIVWVDHDDAVARARRVAARLDHDDTPPLLGVPIRSRTPRHS